MTISSSDLWEECWVSLRSVVVKMNSVKSWTQNEVGNIYYALQASFVWEDSTRRQGSPNRWQNDSTLGWSRDTKPSRKEKELLIFVCKSITVWLLWSILYRLILCVFRKWWWTENAIGIGATKMLKWAQQSAPPPSVHHSEFSWPLFLLLQRILGPLFCGFCQATNIQYSRHGSTLFILERAQVPCQRSTIYIKIQVFRETQWMSSCI